MDTDGFVAFYTRYYRLVLTVAHQRLGGFSDAEDAAAEVFRVAWAHHCAGQEVTLPWVYVTLRNVVGNEYRRNARVLALVERVGPMVRPDAAAVPVDDVVMVRAAMAKLPAAEQGLLAMAYWEDLSAPEMAQILGCTATAVRIRLTRARRRLKALVELEDGARRVTAQ